MEHYDLSEWAELARSELSADKARRMREHLADGCRSCRELQAAALELTELADVAGKGPLRIREDVLWAAKVIFGGAREARSGFPTLPTELVFEAANVPGGVRAAGGSDSWQGVFHADTVTVDLQLDLDPSRDRVAVIGQVADLEDRERGLAQLPACLKVRDETVARAMTNAVGEFRMEYNAGEAPELRIGIPERGLFAVTLDRQLAGTDDDAWSLGRDAAEEGSHELG